MSGGTCEVNITRTQSWISGAYTYAVVEFTVAQTGGYTNFIATYNFRAGTNGIPVFTPNHVNRNNSTLPAPGYACSELPIVRTQRNTAVSPSAYYVEATNNPAGMNGNTLPICP